MAIQKFNVSRDEAIYEAFPDIVQTKSGKLICVFNECEHHLDRTNARVMITESFDRGRTWSPKKPLSEPGTRKAFLDCPRISLLRDGTMLVICTMVTYEEKGRRAEQYIWRGDSEGEHFEGPQILPFCGIVPDKIQELSTGRILIAAHFESLPTEAETIGAGVSRSGERGADGSKGKLQQYLWYSDDHGKTWSDRVTVAADPRYNLCEVSILEMHDGTLVGFLRENSGTGVDILKTLSFDHGETWTPVYETPMDCGHRPVAGYLNDGRIMVTYRYISGGAQNMFAAFLREDQLKETERKAQRCRVMPLDYDRNPSPDLGYTGWTQFADGEIYVVNYIKDDADKAFIRGYSFYPEDIELPVTERTTRNVF